MYPMDYKITTFYLKFKFYLNLLNFKFFKFIKILFKNTKNFFFNTVNVTLFLFNNVKILHCFLYALKVYFLATFNRILSNCNFLLLKFCIYCLIYYMNFNRHINMH